MEALNSVLQSDEKNMTKMAVLLCCYGFDLEGLSALEYIDNWLTSYSRYWIRLAIIEALYQGRYKAISVDHILHLWKRRGQPTFHFTHEFERLICRHLILDSAMIDKGQSQPSITEITDSQETIPIDQPDGNDHQDKTLDTVTGRSTEEVPKIFRNIPLPPDSTSRSVDSDEETSESEPPVPSDLKWELNHNHQALSDKMTSERSIHQFIPHSDSSQLYSKLRAVMHRELAQQPQR